VQLTRRPPAEGAHLGAVDRVAAIVTEPVVDVLDHVLTSTEDIEDALGQLTVGDLVSSTDVVDLADLTAPGDQVDTRAVVVHVAPVPDVETVAVERDLAPL